MPAVAASKRKRCIHDKRKDACSICTPSRLLHIRKKREYKPCPHGNKYKQYCVECGGKGACVKHGRIKRMCPDPECGGGQGLCVKHRISKRSCKDPECGGGQALCLKHRIDKRICKDPECGGGQGLCLKHRINKRMCSDPECGGGQDRCEKHGIKRRDCKDPECEGGQNRCIKHGIIKGYCKDPECGGGWSLCIKHQIVKGDCKDPECGGGQYLCIKHKIEKRICKDPECGGGQDLCTKHRINKRDCNDPACGGGQNFCKKHNIMKRFCTDPECGSGTSMCQKHGILRRNCRDPECEGGQNLCIGCFMNLTNRVGVYCRTCKPVAAPRSKIKEMRVNFQIDQSVAAGNLPQYTSQNKAITERVPVLCGRYQPDILWKFDLFAVIEETDERQHKDRVLRCEMVRINELCNSLGQIPLTVIRFNPDSFSVNGKTKTVPMKIRYSVLIDQLKTSIEHPIFDYHVTIIWLFYDKTIDDGDPYVMKRQFATLIDYAAYVDEVVPFDTPPQLQWKNGKIVKTVKGD